MVEGQLVPQAAEHAARPQCGVDDGAVEYRPIKVINV